MRTQIVNLCGPGGYSQHSGDELLRIKLHLLDFIVNRKLLTVIVCDILFENTTTCRERDNPLCYPFRRQVRQKQPKNSNLTFPCFALGYTCRQI